ncbi:Hypothetical protein BSSP2_I1092 [Brucella suis bv. 2]|nr:Hypothetical protein BSSP3_I1090 [Brucella suis bv. 2]AIB20737.1 Hypothetical protein BSPT1_I0637 [Brucella suis bv. 2]AIB27490.1 Hypothetical protein BSSP1_I0627 [Brucella suis bv. 2]AIB31311.1 Hypothetical protein BSSP2_I1092 [Brucella suis bv. 2]
MLAIAPDAQRTAVPNTTDAKKREIRDDDFNMIARRKLRMREEGMQANCGPKMDRATP